MNWRAVTQHWMVTGKFCNGAEKRIVHGTYARAQTPHGMVTWIYWNGVEKMVVHGMNLRVRKPHGTVTWMFYNGAEKRIVHGIKISVLGQQVMVTWMYCNGVERTVVYGMKWRVKKQPKVGNWMYCNGAERMVVRGINGRVVQLRWMVICIYCNGVEKMAVHGMERHVLLRWQRDTRMYYSGVETMVVLTIVYASYMGVRGIFCEYRVMNKLRSRQRLPIQFLFLDSSAYFPLAKYKPSRARQSSIRSNGTSDERVDTKPKTKVYISHFFILHSSLNYLERRCFLLFLLWLLLFVGLLCLSGKLFDRATNTLGGWSI